MKDKVQQFPSEQRNLIYSVHVKEDGSWVAYVSQGRGFDWANPIKIMHQFPIDLRPAIKEYIRKCKANFAADKVS